MKACRTFDILKYKFINKNTNILFVRTSLLCLFSAMQFLFAMTGMQNEAVAQEFPALPTRAANKFQIGADKNRPIYRIVRGRNQPSTSSSPNWQNTMQTTPGGTQAVEYYVEMVLNPDGSCSSYLGAYQITQQPKLGYLTTALKTIDDFSVVGCPAASHTVNVLYYTVYGAALIGNNDSDQFSYTWTPPAGGGPAESNTLYMGIVTINGPSSVWWR